MYGEQNLTVLLVIINFAIVCVWMFVLMSTIVFMLKLLFAINYCLRKLGIIVIVRLVSVHETNLHELRFIVLLYPQVCSI